MKFGRLTAIKEVPKPDGLKGSYRFWLCKCECGNERIVSEDHLKSGHTKSCGCYSRDNLKSMHKKYNKFDLSGEYGICYPSNSDELILFDIEDYDKIKDLCWRVQSRRGKTREYKRAIAMHNKKPIKMHRVILGLTDSNIKVDHKNRNALDNRKSNLRTCTTTENNYNTSPKHDGYKGVSQDKRRWVARIRVDGKQISIGRCDTAEEAAIAYNEKAKEIFGEFAYINEIKMEEFLNG